MGYSSEITAHDSDHQWVFNKTYVILNIESVLVHSTTEYT